MQTKPLLFGLIGFFIGGFLVSVAANTFEKPESMHYSIDEMMSNMTMSDMTADLQGETGDEFDEAFIANMIVHHEGAVNMAKLSATNAKHEEVKNLSETIIAAQEKEIAEMKQWQKDWGYSTESYQIMGH